HFGHENRHISYLCPREIPSGASVPAVGGGKNRNILCLARMCTISSWIRTADRSGFPNFVSEKPKNLIAL
ncbi:MAG: hypothetical protein ACLRMJ_12750, partial [Alistipes finegoldii]